ncbi:MAG TPA: Uma2 family endonuclease [Longimicrobiaceae bacterium]|nr:Uma2 family endonuclease [Longimicrobiaceae bacterium]
MSTALDAVPVRLTPQEYLAFERASESKHEYVDGEVRAMGGASLDHATIVSNVSGELRAQLRGRGCRVVTNDVRVKVESASGYLYPDVTVVCGKPELEDDRFDTLMNPGLIVEVLSPSTGDYDRGKKWEKYRQIPSLREYVIISQDRAHVERYTRQGERFWVLFETADLDETVELTSIGAALRLGDVYEQVGLTPAAGGTTAETTQ